MQYPLLTADNYAVWAMKKKANMRAQRVWDAVDPKGKVKDVDDHLDQSALAVIYQAVPDTMMRQLIAKETAREAWTVLQTLHD